MVIKPSEVSSATDTLVAELVPKYLSQVKQLVTRYVPSATFYSWGFLVDKFLMVKLFRLYFNVEPGHSDIYVIRQSESDTSPKMDSHCGRTAVLLFVAEQRRPRHFCRIASTTSSTQVNASRMDMCMLPLTLISTQLAP